MKYSSLVLIVLIVFSSGCGFDCESYLEENVKPLSVDGIVVSKSKSPTGCFGIIILKSGTQTDTLQNVCYCVPEEQGLWKYIEAGDSLHKSQASLVVEVFRSGQKGRKFDYPCCSR